MKTWFFNMHFYEDIEAEMITVNNCLGITGNSPVRQSILNCSWATHQVPHNSQLSKSCTSSNHMLVHTLNLGTPKPWLLEAVQWIYHQAQLFLWSSHLSHRPHKVTPQAMQFKEIWKAIFKVCLYQHHIYGDNIKRKEVTVKNTKCMKGLHLCLNILAITHYSKPS